MRTFALTRHGHPVRHHRRHPGQAHHLVDEERLWTHAADRRQRQPTDRISVEAGLTKTYLRTTGSLSTGQTIETTLDPTSLKVCIGYRF